MKLHDRKWQTIDDTLAILCNIQTLQEHLPNEVEGLHQTTATAIKATLCWNDWEQVSMFLPLTEHLSFHIPATAFADQGHCQQFAVWPLGRWTGSLEKRSNFEPY